MRVVLDGRQSQMWTALPAVIVSVNLVSMTVSAQPTIQGTVTNSESSTTNVNLPLLVDVPIVFPSAGGFALTFPIIPGDEALIVFSSRCIDSWWSLGGVGVPLESRMHDLSDGFAILGPKSLPKVFPSVSATATQLRNLAGTSYIGVNAAGLIQCKSTTKNLKGVLDGMLDLLTSLETALTTFSSVAATDPIATVVAGAAATLAGTLATLTPQIAAYKITDIGGLTQ